MFSRIESHLGRSAALVACTAALIHVAPVAAQDTVSVGVREPRREGAELSRQIAEALVDFHNRATTIRFSGRTRLPAGATIDGDVAILGGPVEIGGTITGSVVVVNSDVTFVEGARVDGDLTVAGGVVFGGDAGEVSGSIITYASILRYRRIGEYIEFVGTGDPRPPPTRTQLALPDWKIGDAEVFVSARGYNRVEGLPVALGPRITTGGRNPLRLEALIVWRSENAFDFKAEKLGYEVRAKQWFGGYRDIWLEGSIWSIIRPIERWQITNLENSLSLFLTRRDRRDYYERTGWYAQAGWRISRSLFSTFEFKDERHKNETAGSPWTVFFNTNDPFRPNAAVNTGDLQSIVLTIGHDTRSDQRRPLTGWYNNISLEQGLSGDLSGASSTFTHLFLDLRRYNRVSFGSVLAFRLGLGGRLDDKSLPAQRQHALGGPGSLPGYSQFEFDCGAHADSTFGAAPGYGCARFTLFQAEFRTGLNFKFKFDHNTSYGPATHAPTPQATAAPRLFSIELEPTIVMFFDAGAAWNTDDGYFDHLTKSNNWVSDIGTGIDLGGFGGYIAFPLNGTGGAKGIIRLSARF